ncbi:copper resistance CopC family protein [Parasedimentitalea psychrophila]|uniref:Copper resistance protein CopC n=1 Tax=Parasedimentitalea psychrophila TaxID=2997337 RepID=A0A9Y2P5K7_9RHOB|nr:copper resistance CopC family protein [Parasedimentitalea psychrophila]WIY24078.1 copper resistance protein CopC [Parasedimentitalea psychrophila]
MKIIITMIVSALLASGASAHSKVSTTTPSNHAELADVPAQIGFDFAKNIRLTKVKVTHDNDPAVPVDLVGQTDFERIFTLPLPDMGDGTYHIEWRGLGMDGHAMQGDFTFEVN